MRVPDSWSRCSPRNSTRELAQPHQTLVAGLFKLRDVVAGLEEVGERAVAEGLLAERRVHATHVRLHGGTVQPLVGIGLVVAETQGALEQLCRFALFVELGLLDLGRGCLRPRAARGLGLRRIRRVGRVRTVSGAGSATASAFAATAGAAFTGRTTPGSESYDSKLVAGRGEPTWPSSRTRRRRSHSARDACSAGRAARSRCRRPRSRPCVRSGRRNMSSTASTASRMSAPFLA